MQLQKLKETIPEIEEGLVGEIYRENPDESVQVAIHGFANFLKYADVFLKLGYTLDLEDNAKYPQAFGGFYLATLNKPKNTPEDTDTQKAKPGRKPKAE